MSKIHPKRAEFSEVFTKFPGICSDAAPDSGAATDILNFRVRNDGTLEKRPGWRTEITMPYSIRGYWYGIFHQVECRFFVSDNKVYYLDEQSLSPEVVGSLYSYTGKVCIFLYGGDLYLMDGTVIYSVKTGPLSLFDVSPYVPLIGDKWSPSQRGELLEKPNLLTSHMRVRYENPLGESDFELPYVSVLVPDVLADGEPIDDYEFTPGTSRVHLNTDTTGKTVEIRFVCNRNSDLTAQIQGATLSYVHCDEKHESVFLFGAAQGYRVFTSLLPDDGRMEECRQYDPDSAPLYFPEDRMLLVGDRVNPVTAVCRHYDCALVFNRKNTWLVTFDTDGYPACSPVFAGIGAAADGCAAEMENGIYAVGETGVYRLSATASHPERVSSERISDGVWKDLCALVNSDTAVCKNPLDHELWIRDTTEASGTVWIYHTAQKVWYRFSGIPATAFPADNGAAEFLSGKKYCRFSDLLTKDDGTSFPVSYQSARISFSAPETEKRAMSASVTADTANSSVTLTVETEHTTLSASLDSGSGDQPKQFERRLHTGRFRFFRFRLQMNSEHRLRINRIAFYAKK